MTTGNTKVLIVDDEPEFREILVFDFENSGYITVEAQSATTALAMLKQHPDIKVIISDIKMPDGDGVSLLKSIQERKIRENIILIFVTGFSELKIDEALDIGADGFMMKPFNRRALTAAVERLLLSESERWAKSEPTASPEKKIKIKLSLPSLEIAKRDHLLNIGRGGMFLAYKDPAPEVGSLFEFDIDFNQGPLKTLQGQGIVRWNRKSSDANLPTGLGVEYFFVKDEARTFLINNQPRHNQLAFIPKN